MFFEVIHNETIFAMIKVKKWTVKKIICSYAVIIFMNSYNAVGAFTELSIGEINNADLLQ